MEQHALDSSLPGLDEILDRLVDGVRNFSAADSYQQEIKRAVERVVMDGVMRLAGSAPLSQVRALAQAKLRSVATSYSGSFKRRHSLSSPLCAAGGRFGALLQKDQQRPRDP